MAVGGSQRPSCPADPLSHVRLLLKFISRYMKKKKSASGVCIMARGEKRISDQEIFSAKKALQSLEPKIVGKSRDEAFIALEKELKEALKKGYSIKEISDVLKNNGVIMPVSYLKKLTESERKKRTTKKNVTQDLNEIFQKKNDKNSEEEDSKNFVRPDIPDDDL